MRSSSSLAVHVIFSAQEALWAELHSLILFTGFCVNLHGGSCTFKCAPGVTYVLSAYKFKILGKKRKGIFSLWSWCGVCTKECKQPCAHCRSCLCVDLPSPICFEPTLQISKTAPGRRDVPRLQVAKRRASGKRLLVRVVRSMRDHRWTWGVLGWARRRRGHMGWSVWKLKLHDNSSEITSLQELPVWIWGDHVTGCFAASK